MAVRIKDVADYCGFSPGAVSQVLRNNGHRIPEKTRQKILAAIDELGYRPNNLSVGLRQKHSNLLSLIIPWGNSELMDTVEQEAYRHGFRVMVSFTTSPDAEREIANLDNALDWHVDGILWLPFANPEQYPERLLNRLESSNTKIVFLQRRLPNVSGALVGFDFRQGLFDAVRHIAESGFKKVVLIQIKTSFELRSLREKYFYEALTEHPLPHDHKILDDESMIRPLLAAEKDYPVAYICDNDRFALEFLEATRKSGIKIPEQIGAVTVGDHLLMGYMRLSQIACPKLSALRMDFAQQGKVAVQHVVEMIKGGEPGRDILLPLPFYANHSTQITTE